MLLLNKRVRLCERKRHIARRVASVRYADGGYPIQPLWGGGTPSSHGGGGGTPSSTPHHPDLAREVPWIPPPSRPGQGVPRVPPSSRPSRGYPRYPPTIQTWPGIPQVLPHPDLGWGTPHHPDLDRGSPGYPPHHPDLGWGNTPPPVEVWTDTQSENITFPHPSDAGGKKSKLA